MTPDVRLEPIPVSAYPGYRREAIWAACKWDPQIGDVNAIAEHAVVLASREAEALCDLAARLAAESLDLERELLARPALIRTLGLGRKLERALALAGPERPDDLRLARYDFHPTDQGWALSEVNADVPGGLGEAAILPRLAACLLPGLGPPRADPAAEVAAAFARRLPQRGTIALVHATAYSDDRQVMEYLAGVLRAQGFHAVMASPDHLRLTRNGKLECIADGEVGPVHGIYRFFPAEWLPNLSPGWERYFRAGVPACNHPVSLLSQTKRAPLVWDRASSERRAWRACLPLTVDPRRAAWARDPAWVLKPALGRVGQDVALRDVVSPSEWKRIHRSARRHPRDWVAQRRFTSAPVPARDGERHVCVGVYTVEGRAAGFYARVSAIPRIDQFAQDAPVLVERAAGRGKDGHEREGS